MPTIKDLIDRIMYESTLPNSVFKNADETMVAFYAKEGLGKLNLTFLQGVMGMSLRVPMSCKAYFPLDYMGFLRAYIVNCDGRTIELHSNPNIPSDIKRFMMDCDGTIVTDCDTTEIYDECIYCEEVGELSNGNKCNPDCNHCHGTGRYLSTSAQQLINDINTYKNSWIKIHNKEKYIEFSSDLEGVSVMIEYMSNQLTTVSECKLDVPQEFIEILDYYIKYKVLESDIDMATRAPMYYQNYKKLRDLRIVKTNPLTTDDIYKALLKNK